MRIAFATCVKLGFDCIEEIFAIGGSINLIITLEDDVDSGKSGRVHLEDFCYRHRVDLLKVRNINSPRVVQALQTRSIDWLFIIGWSQIAKTTVLNAPVKGALGMHPTLLPEGRGRAAIPWAILKGLQRTGVTLFKLDEGVDTGPIIDQVILPIAQDETATTLYERVCLAHRSLIRKFWAALVCDNIVLIPQDNSGASDWPGRTPADGQLFETMRVEEVDRLVRATTRPYPGAYFSFEDRIVRVWKGHLANEEDLSEDSLRFSVRDGIFVVTEYEFEAKSV